MYTIDDFWIPSLGRRDAPLRMERAPAGWTTNIQSFSPFIEAPLELLGDFGMDADYPIILVSAPGAVGKSTLAIEIAARTGAILLDLAQADAVGAATVTGGLAWAGLFDRFLQGNVALLIDGLDEARIRVTQDSFAAFLEDISKLASTDRKPVTIFGRTSAIEDAWLTFAESNVEPPVLEIQFHGPDAALEFVMRRIASARNEKGEDVNATADADRRAAAEILRSLGRHAQVDGNRFVGYAPVLIAVAKRVAAERNPMALVQALELGADALSLNGIVDAIIDRERSKLDQLEFTDPQLKDQLYGKAEQIERLILAVYEIDHAPNLPEMKQEDAETYKNALDRWVPDHPFTDGSGKRPSSEVFGGYIAAEALKIDWASEGVRRTETESAKVNPFVWRFRLPERWTESEEADIADEAEFIPLADLGLAFASLQALLHRSESAHLYVDADVDESGSQSGRSEVEITRYLDGGFSLLRLSSECAGAMYFGSRIRDVNISGSDLNIVTSGSEVAIAAPVDLDVGEIDVGHAGIVVEGPGRGKDDADAVVRMRCQAFSWRNSSLSVRTGVELAVDWPGSEHFPWHSYRKPEIPQGIDEVVGERLRRLRKILLLFQAKGKGQLAKFKDAIDHDRRSRGSGAAVRDLLLREGILFEDGRVYVLDTDRMSEVLGLTFSDIRLATVNEQTIGFLRRV